MEKVLISNKQKKALDNFLNNNPNTANADIMEAFIDYRHMWSDVYKPLKDFTVEQFSLILNGWYTVKEDLEEGCWYKHVIKNTYYKVDNITGENSFISSKGDTISNPYFINKLTKVTGQLENILLNFGRENPILTCGDIVMLNSETSYMYCGDNHEKTLNAIKNHGIKYLYPVDTRLSTKK
jgi:hypothetical protein